MRPAESQPQYEDGHTHDLPSAHTQRAHNQHSYEVEPPYLPGPENHSFRMASPRTSPCASTSRRSTWTDANDSTLDQQQPKPSKNEDGPFEMQQRGHAEPPAAAQQGLSPNVPPGNVTPYLGLRARLTQVPLNRWTVLLFLVLARMLVLFGTLNTDLAGAKSEALSACTKVC